MTLGNPKTFLVLLFILSSLNPFLAKITSQNHTQFTNNRLKQHKEYKVIAVCDGDTVVISNKVKGSSTKYKVNLCSHNVDLKKQSALSNQQSALFKVRLLGIDAFEIEQNKYGKEAKDFLTKMLLNKKVCVETDVQEKDKYDRTLGYVFTEPAFINEELVKNGLAIVYSFPPNTKYIQKLKNAQIYARQNMLGVWKESNYILETPTQWRKKH